MGSLHRLSRESRPLHSPNDYRIYAPFRDNIEGSTFIDCYTPHPIHSWDRLTPIPESNNLILKDFAMVSLDYYIYVIGGRHCGSAEHDESCSDVIRSVRRYNTKTNIWDECATMAQPRFNFACTVSNGKIYVAGGQSTLGRAKGVSSTEVYDPALDQWRPLPNMTMKRYKCVAVPWQGKIHVVGGFVDSDQNPGPFIMTRSSAEFYDPEKNKWIFRPDMWALDVPPNQIVAVNGKLFSSGDCFKPWKGHIETYDEKENIWNVVRGSYFDGLSANESPMKRFYLTMAPVENQMYFLAGYRIPGQGSEVRSEVHIFDTAENGDGWRSMEPIDREEREKELCGHCCVLKQES